MEVSLRLDFYLELEEDFLEIYDSSVSDFDFFLS